MITPNTPTQQAETPAPTPPLPPPPTSAPGTAGGPPQNPPVSLPNVGAVTYAGDMSGIANGRSATGSYQNAWNFATRSGNFTATFDGRSYQGMMFGNGNSPIFGTKGPVPSSNSTSQMQAIGTFIGKDSQSQRGFFVVHGPRYIGGGEFNGEKR